jgi:hypothetical protein
VYLRTFKFGDIEAVVTGDEVNRMSPVKDRTSSGNVVSFFFNPFIFQNTCQ